MALIDPQPKNIRFASRMSLDDLFAAAEFAISASEKYAAHGMNNHAASWYFGAWVYIDMIEILIAEMEGKMPTYSLKGFTTDKTRFRNWGARYQGAGAGRHRVQSTWEDLHDLGVKVYRNNREARRDGLHSMSYAKRHKLKIEDQPEAVLLQRNTHLVLLFRAVEL